MSGPLPAHDLAAAAHVALVAVHSVALALLGLVALHRWIVLARFARRRALPPPPSPRCWPRVTVQLPVYNERTVVGRLIHAAAALRYPRDRLEIQVLDDSTDDTTDRARAVARALRRRGIDVRVLHRRRRRGFKAGALAAGLARARGEIVAIFDADFVPAPDFLERVVPRFEDPAVGMVQARWGHLNRGDSWRTAAQAALLDYHFLVEHEARRSSGLFLSFNGTAGAWRRACIESAGGWEDDTLTEDLDLSYRAQLAGWRFVFDPGVVADGELPTSWRALMSQHRRWSRGSIQTARKLLPRVLAAPLPARVRIEAAAHLLGNAVTVPALAAALLAVPAALALAPPAAGPLLGLALGLLPVVAGMAAAGRLAHGRLALRDVAAGVVLVAALAVNDAGAALAGLRRRRGPWERTPKRGDRGEPGAYAASRRGGGGRELVAAAGFAAAAVMAGASGRWEALPLPALFLVGLAVAGRGAWREGRRVARAGRSCSSAAP